MMKEYDPLTVKISFFFFTDTIKKERKKKKLTSIGFLTLQRNTPDHKTLNFGTWCIRWNCTNSVGIMGWFSTLPSVWKLQMQRVESVSRQLWSASRGSIRAAAEECGSCVSLSSYLPHWLLSVPRKKKKLLQLLSWKKKKNTVTVSSPDWDFSGLLSQNTASLPASEKFRQHPVYWWWLCNYVI